MSLNNTLAALMLGTALTSVAYSQDEIPIFQNDVTVQAFGSFVKKTTNNGIEQNATNSGGVLGTYRRFFNDHHGVEANYGYALNTQNYLLSAASQGVKTYSHEISAAYVLRFPQRRWTPFVLGGVGALVFDPKDFVGGSAQTRPAFVYGGGADVRLSAHLFLRAQYRGFVYSSPTYDFAGLNDLDRVTHRAQPSVGFGWSF